MPMSCHLEILPDDSYTESDDDMVDKYLSLHVRLCKLFTDEVKFDLNIHAYDFIYFLTNKCYVYQ